MADIIAAAFEFETERLQLRLLAARDEALFCGLYTDPETMRFIGQPLTAGQAARYFQRAMAGMHQQPCKWLYLAILEKESGQPLGVCGVPQFDKDATRLEVGLVLATEARSRGYAREGLAALVKRVFEVSSVVEIWAQFSTEHVAAERLVIDIGFSSCTYAPIEPGFLSKRIWSIPRSS
ncbi:GNAT family N-acetyltransferase [Rhodanobacter sp. C05]|uniref:GNAT family N-acetyltransferase n=1 Tax=Rhodanobacter sp. C05 TaxID=1945855 RepID=UPI0009D1AE4E|nr:GNAT family N-acetyltransferase [Rhodanobacter sp. C05]OOG38138.1 hypothetical protein B0E51_14910 [Rhodanobacter sp. C05]